jgi:hypothetical protein
MATDDPADDPAGPPVDATSDATVGDGATTGTDASQPATLSTRPSGQPAEGGQTGGRTTVVGPGGSDPSPYAGADFAGSTTTSTTEGNQPVSTGDDEWSETVGPLHRDDTEFVLIGDPTGQRCPRRTLALATDGEPGHRYTNLGPVGDLDLHNGPFGQTALVERCGPLTERVLMADTSALAGPIPTLLSIPAPANAALDRFGWLATTGWFAADATATDLDGTIWHETIVFDPTTATSRSWDAVLGRRTDVGATGVDVVVPHDWPVSLDADSLTVDDPWSTSQLTVTVIDGPGEGPGPNDDEVPVEPQSTQVGLWEEIDTERSRRVGWLDGIRFGFDGPDGRRDVHIIELDDRTIRVETTIGSDAGAVSMDLPWLAADTLRIHSVVG